MDKHYEKWKDNNKIYYKIGDDIVLCDVAIYDFENDCWRYAPDVYHEYVNQSNVADNIDEKEAKEIVTRNGGTNFDKQTELLYVVDNEGHYSGIFG